MLANLAWDRIITYMEPSSIDDLQSKMAQSLCDELQSAQLFKFQTLFMAMFVTHTSPNLDFDTKVEQNTFFTFVLVVAEQVEVEG